MRWPTNLNWSNKFTAFGTVSPNFGLRFRWSMMALQALAVLVVSWRTLGKHQWFREQTALREIWFECTKKPRWWFQTFYSETNVVGLYRTFSEDSYCDEHIFPDGLKPPTSNKFHPCWWSNVKKDHVCFFFLEWLGLFIQCYLPGSHFPLSWWRKSNFY